MTNNDPKYNSVINTNDFFNDQFKKLIKIYNEYVFFEKRQKKSFQFLEA
jgi:hypothetical protein